MEEKYCECFGYKYRIRANWNDSGSQVHLFDYDNQNWQNTHYIVENGDAQCVFRRLMLADASDLIESTIASVLV